jgi:hypothetical protein
VQQQQQQQPLERKGGPGQLQPFLHQQQQGTQACTPGAARLVTSAAVAAVGGYGGGAGVELSNRHTNTSAVPAKQEMSWSEVTYGQIPQSLLGPPGV